MRARFDALIFGRSFVHAWRGLRLAFKEEQSFRFQVFVGLLVIGFAMMIPVLWWQRITIFIVTSFVLVLELINSCVERLVDLTRPRLDERAKDIKDLMAGAVLVASAVAVMIGVMILGPIVLSEIRFFVAGRL